MQIDNNIRSYGKENKVPITLDDTLLFLVQTINKNDCKQILEIGTAIGFGCITIAQNTNCEHIDTVEIDNTRYEIANNNISKCGLTNKISTNLIDAKQFLETCNKKYDLVSVTNEEWEKIREEYIKNIKSGKKYEYIEIKEKIVSNSKRSVNRKSKICQKK